MMLSCNGYLYSKYSQLKNYCMNNIPTTTPGFVLTSLSFNTEQNKKNAEQNFEHRYASQKSSIAKFDYCLPPEEASSAEMKSDTHFHF